MKYRIIKHGSKKPYYKIQYVDSSSLEWVGSYQVFRKRRDAIKTLRNIARTQLEREQVRVIEEDEI